ncbi:hypothetical protein J7T55_013299 [Diaporthe amygdali]|uniref:uncharacterized protein n=1 Tax=Phomopsis amygdali TaxID=1214568 RepID=UPI0022FE86B9|nr:uncharacterized protein J7T55_013299 [Diaporthe amygdali]KAJ0119064.1 hypothetical protein J7T55_013299 [Diaporthe amygdali]
MLFTKSILLGLAALAVGHPGHEEEERLQAVNARAATARTRRALEGCTSQLEARGVYARAMERRRAAVEAHRIAKRIPLDTPYTMSNNRMAKRNTTDVLNKDHQGDLNASVAIDDPSYVFNSTTCTVLNPEGEVGPFYVLGEYIRSDLVTNEAGVAGIPFVADIQFINVDTCEPLVDVWADVWSCNATGVYGGVQSSMNGNPSDATNLNNTALRGIQKSDSDGVVQFSSIFPGHYGGRTTHQHIVVHENATVQSNGTLTGGSVPHIGQVFWDQSLITEIEALSPYSENTARLTPNSEDHVFGQQETEGTDSDPVYNYVYFSDDVNDGLFGWIVIGINPSASYTPTYSFALTEGGGVAVGNGGGGGGPGGPPPSS